MLAMTRLALLGFAALSVGACNPSEEGAPQGEEPASAPAAAEAPPVDPLAVTAAGVGPITAATPFDREALAALFPGAAIDSAYLTLGSETVAVLNVAAPEPGALTVRGGEGGSVTEVTVQAGGYRAPNGASLGAPWPELGLTASDCVMGQGAYQANPVCRRADVPNVAYVLAVPRWRGADLPDATTLNGRATLAAIIWTPGA